MRRAVVKIPETGRRRLFPGSLGWPSSAVRRSRERASVKGDGTRRRSVGVQLQFLYVPSPKTIQTAFRTAAKGHAEALLVLQSPVFINQRPQLTVLAVKSRLPTIYDRQEFVDDAGLLSYGTSFATLSLCATAYVDKILKGARPADLPVEQPNKFELIINLKAAKRIGLTIPPNLLARADKVIR